MAKNSGALAAALASKPSKGGQIARIKSPETPASPLQYPNLGQKKEAKNTLGHPISCRCCCVCTGQHADLIGDSFVYSCRACGIFLPKSGHKSLRLEKKFKMPCDAHVADILRTAYGMCLNQ